MKKTMIALAAVLTLSGFQFAFATQTAPQPERQVQIVPWPNRITVGDGFLSLAGGVAVKGTKGFAADYLTDMLRDEYGIASGKTRITFTTDAKLAEVLGGEGYTLDIDARGIRIAAAGKTGLFYGVQTLRQLITADKTVPYVSIEDRPAFGWRAFLLDEARYFKGKEVARKMIDEMARLKMNVLQWHLTDDAGWRIEIKKYPLLTEVGSKRDSSEIGTWGSGRYDPTPQGGLLYAGRDPGDDRLCGGPGCHDRAGDRDAGPCFGGYCGVSVVGDYEREDPGADQICGQSVGL